MAEEARAMDQRVTLEVTAAEAQAIITGLRFLLEAERDPDQIDELKQLIARLERAAARA